MRMKPRSLDEWRSYFKSSNSNIFEVLEHAMVVAASDYPNEFRARRDGIAERLFSSRLTRCLGCDHVQLAVPEDAKDHHDDDCGHDDDGLDHDDNDLDGGCKREEAGVSKESKVNSSGNGDGDMNHVSNYSFGEAEALTDEIEEESQYVGEILRIKDVLFNHEDESESVLFDSLRRLQLMELTVDCLKATEIGKAVNPLRKHVSKEICHLARTLIKSWKELVDEWVKATTTTVAGSEGNTPDSINPSVVDDDEEEEEEGLPSPPLDEGAFFVAPAGSMELSQFFDGMDDDGNPRPSGQFNRNLENGRKPALNNQVMERRKPLTSHETAITTREVKIQQTRKNEAPVRMNKPVTADSGPGRPPKSNMQRKTTEESRMQQKIENNSVTRRPPVAQLDKSVRSEDEAVQMKLEATKRRLQESYQQAENAKRQRTIQVMEINDLPKQGVHRNSHFKPGYHNRHWANGRR